MLRWKATLTLILGLSVIVPVVQAAQKVYSKGKLVDVQRKTKDKVDMYLVNTPVTTEVPYFQVSVEVGNTDFVAEYTPRHADEELPEPWKVGEEVQCRVEKHHLYLQRPDGSETQWIITKKVPVSKEQSHQ